MKVTLTRKLPGGHDAKLPSHFIEVVTLEHGEPLGRGELKAALKGTDVLICTVSDRIDEEILSVADRLKCIVTFSVGVDHIDLNALKARKIQLAHTPQVLTDATADLTLALILGCARRIKPAVHFIEEGKFRGLDPGLFLGMELSRSVLGVVGLGKIGMAVARRALAFGMKVVFTSSKPHGDQADFKEVPLGELLRISDVVSLHCPLTPSTRHLIGRRELSVMKPNGILVNAARGPIVDEKALLAHLRTHPDFFAGLDVFEDEPVIVPGLRQLPNALCLPHIGSATVAARGAMAEVCCDEAIRFAKGQRLRYEYQI